MIKKKYVKLPSAYQEVEYIESSKQQGIRPDLGIGLNENIRIEAQAKFTGFTSNSDTFFGNNESMSNRVEFKFYSYDTTHVAFAFGDSWSNPFSAPTKNELHSIVVEATTSTQGGTASATLAIDNSVVANVSGTFGKYNYTTAYIHVFGAYVYNNYKDIPSAPSSMKLYSFKMYTNDVLIADMVPCYRKSDNETGMYDVVRNTFYPRYGTRQFYKGSDISGTMKEVKNIMTKVNGSMKQVKAIKIKSAMLPVEYQQVSYIQSTGVQGVYTGITVGANQEEKIELKMAVVSYGTRDVECFLGWSVSPTTKARYQLMNNYGNGLYFLFGDKSCQITNFTVETVYDVSIETSTGATGGSSSATVKVNGAVDGTITGAVFGSTSYETASLNACAANLNSGSIPSSPSKMKIYSLKAYKNGVLEKDLVPCYRKSDNMTGLYDIVSGTFYERQGVAQFTKGANVADTMKTLYEASTNGS